MKKKLFLAMSICVCACGAFFASCDKDDDNGIACTCMDWDGDQQKRIINTAKYGVSNCDDLIDKLNEANEYKSDYECWNDKE